MVCGLKRRRAGSFCDPDVLMGIAALFQKDAHVLFDEQPAASLVAGFIVLQTPVNRLCRPSQTA